MSEIQEKKDLKDIMRKCRCCLRLIIDDRRAVEIDEMIREQFYNLTTISLLKVDSVTNRICQLCASDLETFSNLRNDLIEKQTSLYSILGLDIVNESEHEQEMILIEEMPAEKQDHMNPKGVSPQIEYEIVESDLVDELEDQLWEETIEESEENSEINEDNVYIYSEDENPPNSTLKIEKIEANEMDIDQADSHEYYDNFEEYEKSRVENESKFEEEVTKCDICNINVLQNQFDQHCELMHHELKCEKCDKTFPSKILLKIHNNDLHSVLVGIRGHKSKRKYHFCGLCDKEYEYRKHLEDHIRSYHKKERNRQCPVCKRWFYHRDIKKHIEHVHGEKKITCPTCGKLYTCIENLKLHMRYHDEPKYMCEFPNCNKRFHQKILYEHHVVKHSNEKQVECNQCHATFYTVRDLNRHTQRVHKKVQRKCFGCDQSFYRKDKYREHVLKGHKELNEDERKDILESIRTMKWNDEP